MCIYIKQSTYQKMSSFQSLIDLTNDINEKDIVYIVVDELDDNPKLYRRKSDASIQKCLYICDNVTCNRTSANLKRCTGCFYNRYCSPDCQKQDWSHHKSVCDHTCVGCQKIVKDFDVMKEVVNGDDSIFVKYCTRECEKNDKKWL